MWLNNPVAVGAGLVSYFGLALGLLRWWKIADRRRGSWFSFFPVLATGIGNRFQAWIMRL